MPLRSALDFLQQTRSNEQLREQLRATATLDDAVVLAARHGYAVSKEDIMEAFTRDWAMRALRYEVLT